MGRFKNIPTWVIVLTFIFAWPIGVVLVVLKNMGKDDEVHANVTKNVNIMQQKNRKIDKIKKRRNKYKILSIIQLIIAVVFFFALISDFATDNMDNIEGGIILNVLAFAILTPLCVTYFKLNGLIKKIEAYQNLILIRDIYDTSRLASYIGCSRLEVLDFVSYMIREGYLDLDIENENIVKPKEYVDPAHIFSIVCQNCGATNKYIKGKNNKCEYCGTVLNLNKI